MAMGTARREHKIHVVAGLRAPVLYVPTLSGGVQFVEHKMFPERPVVVSTQRRPSAMAGDESRVKPIHAWCSHDLGRRIRCKRPHHVHDKRRFEHIKIVHHRLSTYLARACEAGRFKNAAAINEQHFEQSRKRGALFKAKQLLHVLRPICVQPLLIVALRRRLGDEKRRWSATRHPVFYIGLSERHHVGLRHGREPYVRFATGQRVTKLGPGAKTRRARGEDADIGVMVGRNFQQLRRILETMDLVKYDAASGMRVKKGRRFRVTRAG